jgi:hypothetical protein
MSTINLEIGDVCFSIRSRSRLLPQSDSPPYRTFLTHPRAGWEGIALSVHPWREDAAVPRDALKIFDSGRSWRVFRDGADFLLSFDSAGARLHPFWLARMNANFSRGAVYCGREFMREMDGAAAIPNPVRYPLDQILLMNFLGRRGGAIIHASSAVIAGRGIIFPGRSGAGKSTIAGCLAARNDFSILSDDRVVVRESGGTLAVFGTPWPGDAGIARNERAPLRGIFFIRPGPAVRITEMAAGEALEKLLPVTSIPWYDREAVPLMLSFLGRLVSRVPAYQLLFAPGAEVADALAKFVSG